MLVRVCVLHLWFIRPDSKRVLMLCETSNIKHVIICWYFFSNLNHFVFNVFWIHWIQRCLLIYVYSVFMPAAYFKPVGQTLHCSKIIIESVKMGGISLLCQMCNTLKILTEYILCHAWKECNEGHNVGEETSAANISVFKPRFAYAATKLLEIVWFRTKIKLPGASYISGSFHS